MIRTRRHPLGYLSLLFALSACPAPESSVSAGAQTAGRARGGDATGETVAAANALLATLDEAARAKIAFPFGGEQRSKWSNFPVGMVPRGGVRMGDLNESQRDAVMKVLAAALSRQGLEEVREIMDGDEVLKTSERGHMGPPPGGPGMGPPGGGPPMGPPGGGDGKMHGPNFGRDEYYLAFLGAPSLTAPWMIQFGGHHLALNLTIVGKDQTLAPSLPCAQPASYQLDGETVRPLGREHDESLALIRSLDAAQKKKAILAYQVDNLVLGPGQDGKTIVPEGIKASELTDAQQRMLLGLAHEWVGLLNDDAATARMAEIASHVSETWFAWSGPTTDDGVAYFRIQGPTLVIEYSPQHSVDHIHTIYRDPTNDYGARLVKR